MVSEVWLGRHFNQCSVTDFSIWYLDMPSRKSGFEFNYLTYLLMYKNKFKKNCSEEITVLRWFNDLFSIPCLLCFLCLVLILLIPPCFLKSSVWVILQVLCACYQPIAEYPVLWDCHLQASQLAIKGYFLLDELLLSQLRSLIYPWISVQSTEVTSVVLKLLFCPSF